MAAPFKRDDGPVVDWRGVPGLQRVLAVGIPGIAVGFRIQRAPYGLSTCAAAAVQQHTRPRQTTISCKLEARRVRGTRPAAATIRRQTGSREGEVQAQLGPQRSTARDETEPPTIMVTPTPNRNRPNTGW